MVLAWAREHRLMAVVLLGGGGSTFFEALGAYVGPPADPWLRYVGEVAYLPVLPAALVVALRVAGLAPTRLAIALAFVPTVLIVGFARPDSHFVLDNVAMAVAMAYLAAISALSVVALGRGLAHASPTDPHPHGATAAELGLAATLLVGFLPRLVQYAGHLTIPAAYARFDVVIMTVVLGLLLWGATALLRRQPAAAWADARPRVTLVAGLLACMAAVWVSFVVPPVLGTPGAVIFTVRWIALLVALRFAVLRDGTFALQEPARSRLAAAMLVGAMAALLAAGAVVLGHYVPAWLAYVLAAIALGALVARGTRRGRSPMPTAEPGDLVAGRFRILATTTPLQAWDEQTAGPVELHALATGHAAERRARRLAAAPHANLQATRGVARSGATGLAIVEPLQANPVRDANLTAAEALRIGARMADALAHLHRAGLVHGRVASAIHVRADGTPVLAAPVGAQAGASAKADLEDLARALREACPRAAIPATTGGLEPFRAACLEALSGRPAKSAGAAGKPRPQKGPQASAGPAAGRPGKPLPRHGGLGPAPA